MTTFGETLKRWRAKRRMSQLDLGLSANVSARHISFLETGRSRPSRSMVLQLCEELEVPKPSRNELLTAAGLSPAYMARDLSSDDMAPVRDAVDWLMRRHAPYPAIAMNRHWVIERLNDPARQLLAGLGVEPGMAMIDVFAENEDVRAAIDNLDEVLAHTIARLRTEITHLGGDAKLEASLAKLVSLQEDGPSAPDSGLRPAFIPTRYRFGGMVFSFFSTFTQFGGAEDIALSELKIEMMFPADEATRQALHALAAKGARF